MRFWQKRRRSLTTVAAGTAQDQASAPELPAPVRIISSLVELDQELAAVDQAFRISDAAGRSRLAEFCFEINVDFPDDPYSEAYKAAQFALYQQLSGRSVYDPHLHEQTPFDVDAATKQPYPYATGSPKVVGEQLMLQGFLIACMNLPAPAKILEFGPGWGNTTLHFAQMGYAVTAVEIEPRFIELLRRRSAMLDVNIELIQADMLEFTSDQRYDAVVFFASFHHCTDHLKLLNTIQSLLNPDGVLVFAAEPIAALSHPWG